MLNITSKYTYKMYTDVEIVASTNWHDGPLEGLCRYNNKLYWFFDRGVVHNRYSYDMFDLPDELMGELLDDLRLFVKFVSCCFIDPEFIKTWARVYDGDVNPNKDDWANYYENKLEYIIKKEDLFGWFTL